MIGVGTHEVTVVETSPGETMKGTPYLQVVFEDEHGDRIPMYLYLSAAAAQGSAKTLRLLGATDAVCEDCLSITAQDLPKRVEIVCANETFEGRDRVRVKWVNRIGGTAIPANKLEEIKARMRAAMLATPAEPEDDIPF